ncbi:beta strand repeat-containing protein [Myroides sp. C15-4]|uniref:beta strand repeat-containing protein n=1 Tax=Myroides sp. C15-4 TaxID=3400532 RepID=UPI003D2F9474
MKKNVLSVALLMVSGITFAQVGIGTANPNPAALLDVEAKTGSYKGVLIPRIPLLSISDSSNLNGGKTPNSLLVFNTTDNADLKPGYYYWFANRWVRLITSTDDFLKEVAKNEELAVNPVEETLFLRDSKNHTVSVPLADVNILTTLESNRNGKYTYTSEDQTQTVLDIPADVIENITTILEDNAVKNEIVQLISAHGKAISGDEIIEVIGGEQAVLHPTTLQVKDRSITTTKIKPGSTKQLLVTDATGEVKWVAVTDEVIQEAVRANERVTILEDNHNGTFTYYNENAIDSQTGSPIRDRGVVFDANTLRIKEREGNEQRGIYDFYDGMTSLQQPLMTISTRANAIYYNNNSTVIEGDNLQSVIENIINKIEIAQGTPEAVEGGGILINGTTRLEGAVLKEMLLTIADGAISEQKLADYAVTTYKLNDAAVTTAKIAPGTDKYILVTKNGAVQWIPATDEIMKEVVIKNETITVLDTSAADGTFTYYSESDFDHKGTLIGPGTPFDANTLTITNNGKGKYIFRDGKTQTGTPLAEIDIVGTVIENITDILNEETVVQQIYDTITGQAKNLTEADASIVVEGGEKAVLVHTKISVAPQGITTDKIAPGGDKFILVTKNGQAEWVPASDEVIKDIVAFNERITLLTVNQNQGTFVYYNEESVDKDGQIIGGGMAFDANTMTISTNGQGQYVFRDGHTRTGDALAEIDIVETIIENITEILNKEEVREQIFETVAAQGKSLQSPNQSIAIEGGAKSVLEAVQLSIAEEGVTTPTLAPQAVTTDKIAPGPKRGQLLVTNEIGEVQWIDASDAIIKEILNGNQAITYIVDSGKGSFTYYNESCFDKEGNLVRPENGVNFDANTLRVVEVLDANDQGTGTFNFYDKSSDAPIATIDVTASVIANIDKIVNDTTVQNALYTTIADQGKQLESTDESIAITGGEKAVLTGVTINVKESGIKNQHLADGAVTVDKIDAEQAAKSTILSANGLGQAFFQPADEAVRPAMQGDLAGEAGVINIVGGGENVLFGDQNKKVTIAINKGGVRGEHIGNRTITNENIATQTIQAVKLNATGEQVGAVATVNANGTVSYLPVEAAAISGKGNITTDGIVSVSDNGTGKVLSDVHLGLNDTAVTALKLSAEGAQAGSVATANADGTVTYQALKGENIADKAPLKTDGIIAVNQANQLEDALLKEATLSIVDQSITADKIANHTITNEQIAPTTITVDKLSAGNEPPKRVMVIDEVGVVKWGELDDIVTDAAGNLTTDGIVELKAGDGINSLFNDVELGIKDNSITNQQIADQTIQINKLSSEGSTAGMVMVTNANGGFTYVDRESIVQAGEDLTLSSELEFLEGTNGISAVLADTKIGISDQGITTEKLADGAVSAVKISAVGAAENTVLTADGQGHVAYKKLNDAAFEGAAADLKSDGSLQIPENNGAVLHETIIGIANQGVENKHLKDNTITATKINAEAAAESTLLASDGEGNASFKTLEDIAIEQGKVMTSAEQTLKITANKALLQDLSIDIAESGIKTKHLDNQAVTADKIGSLDVGQGLVLTSNSQGGAEFKTLGDVLGDGGKQITGGASISVVGGEHAALQDVTLDVTNRGITEAKLADEAVSTSKLREKAVTTQKIAPDGANRILGTDKNGVVKWLDSNDELIKIIVESNESVTRLIDNGDGTFTYYNENQVDSSGNIKPNASGVLFDANTLSITQAEPFVYVFKDQSDITGQAVLATIDTRAKSIVFSDDSTLVYNNVEEAIISLSAKIEQLERLELEKAALSGDGILINGLTSETDAVLKEVTLSIADEAVTTAKIKGGRAKQLLITNDSNKAQWVNGDHDIIKEIVQAHEKVTLLAVQDNGTFVYYNESDVDRDGNIIGTGVAFDANTLSIIDRGKGVYEFYDKSSTDPLTVIDIQGTIIENITELLNDISVKQELFNVIAAQGKTVTAGDAIEVIGGEKAALAALSISLKDSGVTTEKVAAKAITEDKLFAGADKANYVPIVQQDGSVKYQPMTVAVTGQPLTVDSSLEVTGNASKAVLENIGLQVKAEGIANTHLQDLAVTANKIASLEATKGEVLTADGSGNTQFFPIKNVVTPAMQGDLVSDNSLVIEDGENVLFGDANKQVNVKINVGGVTGTHIASETIENNNIKVKTIAASKLTAGNGTENRVALADATGTVTYQPISTQILTSKGQIKTDGIVTVDNGVDKVLADVELGIAPTSITADKLNGGNAPAGAVATVGANGVSVNYVPLTTDHIVNKGTLATDGIITVTDDGSASVLKDITLGIKAKGITTTQLADQAVKNEQIDNLAVTANKLSSQGVTAKSVLISGENNEVVWGELGDIVTDTAGNLTTDNIIQMTGGNGVNTLLKDVNLSIANNSITKDKLSSKDGNTNVDVNHILVTDGQGGFNYVLQEAAQAGGVDLTLGDALAFADGTTGKNAVLALTTIDVKDGGVQTSKLANGAVTTAKISAENAAVNSVLTAIGGGTVAYQALNESAFAGKGANLIADTSIDVTANNKALLSETSIAIAHAGVKNKHLDALAVTKDKISSKEGNTNAANGAVLAADGSGNTSFKTLTDLATTQGKAVTSDSSLEVTANNKAVLQNLTIKVAEKGIKNKHIDTREITEDKIGTSGISSGLVLTADGQGAAKFKSIHDAIAGSGKTIAEGAGITIVGGERAALQDVTISVANKGIDNAKLADNAVNARTIASKAVGTAKLDTGAVTGEKIAENTITYTKIVDAAIRKNHIYVQNIEERHLDNEAVSTRALADKAVTIEKIDPERASVGHVLTVESSGRVAFKPVASSEISKGNLTSKESGLFDIQNGNLAVLKDVTLDISSGGIKTKHIADEAIGTSELKNFAVTSAKIGGKAVKTIHIDTEAVGTAQLEGKAVTQAKLANNAVGYNELRSNAVYGAILKDQGVNEDKIDSGDARSGYVLTADGSGGAEFKAAATGNTGSGELYGEGPIKVSNGNNAVLKNVTLEIKEKSIDTEYITNDAVGYTQLKRDAVYGSVIKDQAITTDKIASKAVGYDELDRDAVYGAVIRNSAITTDKIASNAVGHNELDSSAVYGSVIRNKGVEEDKIDSGNARSGYVLTADGSGGASFQEAQEGGSGSNGMPKFFYLPAMYVEIVSGGSGTLKVYDEYREQFGSPMVSNDSAGSYPSLPVVGRNELNYHVTYYDTAIFYDVRMSNDGVMTYKMRSGVRPTGRTFFNIVLEVK